MTEPVVRVAATRELDADTLYRLLALRTDVFVVEQDCAYPELDRRDLERDARQLWIEHDLPGDKGNGRPVVAALRLLRDPDGRARIGRVVTAAAARGHGLAALLMTRALELVDGDEVVLGAQAHLVGWYARFGFVPDGEPYDEDGIPHVPMRRPGRIGEPLFVLHRGVDDELDPAMRGMQPHPEGGWFRETWRHHHEIVLERGRRSLATCVAFLLQPGEESAWHRVASDELWLWQGGARMTVTLGGDGDVPAADEVHRLGHGGQVLVPAGVWQRAEPELGTSLVACVVAPGFDYDDFTLLRD